LQVETGVAINLCHQKSCLMVERQAGLVAGDEIPAIKLDDASAAHALARR
jgi:hypothetical protein